MNRIFSILVALTLCWTCGAAEPKKKELTLGIEYELWDFAKTTTKPEHFEYTFFVIITNSTDQEVTIPTSSYDGEPCCWLSGGSEQGVTYNVGKRHVGRFDLVDPPERYFPVRLQPGQSAQFARYKLSSEAKLKIFSASLYFDEDFAASQKWWSGMLHARCDLETQKPLK